MEKPAALTAKSAGFYNEKTKMQPPVDGFDSPIYGMQSLFFVG